MRSTFAPVPVAGVGAPLERPRDVLGEDAAQTMSFLVEQRRLQDEAAARELRAVAHGAELHQVDTRTEVGAVDLEVWHLMEARLAEQAEQAAEHREACGATLPVGTGLLGREGELRLAGEGAFTVAEFAVSELAAALGLSRSEERR